MRRLCVRCYSSVRHAADACTYAVGAPTRRVFTPRSGQRSHRCAPSGFHARPERAEAEGGPSAARYPLAGSAWTRHCASLLLPKARPRVTRVGCALLLGTRSPALTLSAVHAPSLAMRLTFGGLGACCPHLPALRCAELRHAAARSAPLSPRAQSGSALPLRRCPLGTARKVQRAPQRTARRTHAPRARTASRTGSLQHAAAGEPHAMRSLLVHLYPAPFCTSRRP